MCLIRFFVSDQGYLTRKLCNRLKKVENTLDKIATIFFKMFTMWEMNIAW